MEPTKWDAFADELVNISRDPSIKTVQKKQIWTDHEGASHAIDVILEKTASAKVKNLKKDKKVDYLADWKKVNPEHGKKKLAFTLAELGFGATGLGVGFGIGRLSKKGKKKEAADKRVEAMKGAAKKLLRDHRAQGAAAGAVLGGAAATGDEMRLRQYEKNTGAEGRKKGRLKYVAGRTLAGAAGGAALAHAGKKVSDEVKDVQHGALWRAMNPFKKKSK